MKDPKTGGRRSFSAAKEKAKSITNRLDRQKESHPYLYKDETKNNKRYSYTATSRRIPVTTANEITPSPIAGNAWGGLMAKNMQRGMSKNEAAQAATSELENRSSSAVAYKNFGVSASPTMMGLMGKESIK